MSTLGLKDVVFLFPILDIHLLINVLLPTVNYPKSVFWYVHANDLRLLMGIHPLHCLDI